MLIDVRQLGGVERRRSLRRVQALVKGGDVIHNGAVWLRHLDRQPLGYRTQELMRQLPIQCGARHHVGGTAVWRSPLSPPCLRNARWPRHFYFNLL